MASRAAVLIDLTVADATPALDSTAASASDAADALTDTENSVKAASKQLRAFAAESARVNRAVRDLATATAAGDSERALALVRQAHGLDIAAKAEAKYAAQVEKATKATKAAQNAEERQIQTLQKLDRAYDRLDASVADAGGKIASFGGMLSLPGLESAAPAVTALGDSLELLASPGGALVAVFGSVAASVGLAVLAIQGMDESTERLRELGYESKISAAQLAAVGDASVALDSVTAASLQLSQAFGAEAAPGIQILAESVANFLRESQPLASTIGRWVSSLSIGVTTVAAFVEVMGEAGDKIPWYASMLSLGTAPLYEMATALDKVIPRAVANAAASREMSKADRDAAKHKSELTEELERERKAREAADREAADRETAERERKAREAAARATKEQAERARELAEALRTLEGIAPPAPPTAGSLEAQYAEIDAINALAQAHLDSAEVQQEADAARARVMLEADAVAEQIRTAERARFEAASAERTKALDEMRAFLDSSSLSAAEVAWQARAAARAATFSATAGQIQGVAGVLGGNVGGALSALGPGGMLLGAAIELGPDTVQILDDRLSEIGDAIVRLPETLAKVLAPIVGFGADNAGEGIGRGIGAVIGGTIGFVVGGGPMGAAAGAALGSAAGGAIGNAAAGSRSEVAARRNRRQATAGVTINGIVTSDVLRSLDREVKAKGGARGLRASLATP
ncbi:MAG: hypothetical protein ACO3GM_00835 [Candidatus Limnocylindrus sp.]